MSNTIIPIELQAVSPAEAQSTLLTPDVSMVILTWITFLALSVVLYKFAWNPILKALDAREELLRRSVAEADRIKEELAKIHETRRQFIREAEEKSRGIISEARKAATQLSTGIQHKAHEEVSILLANARHDIKEETEKARIILREESAQLVIDLAAKLIEKDLDTEGNRKLIHKLIAEV